MRGRSRRSRRSVPGRNRRPPSRGKSPERKCEGNHSGCQIAHGWRAQAQAQLYQAFRAPLAPPRPLRLDILRDQYIFWSEIRSPYSHTVACGEGADGVRERSGLSTDSLTSLSQIVHTRRGARTSSTALDPPNLPVTTEIGGGEGGKENRMVGKGEPGDRQFHKLTECHYQHFYYWVTGWQGWWKDV